MVFRKQDFNARDAAVQLMVAETSTTLILITEIIICYINLHQINIYSELRQYRYHPSYQDFLLLGNYPFWILHAYYDREHVSITVVLGRFVAI